MKTDKHYGLDFGTTNSSISIEKEGVGKVLEIDLEALDKRVVRSMLYFLRREMIFDPKIPPARLKLQIFKVGEITYEGEQKLLVGQGAVDKYMVDNENRSSGIKRMFLTGRIIDAESLEEVKGGAGAVREYYEEIDYGIGRFMQALKTALKSPFYKGTSIFGRYYTLEELIGLYIKEIKNKADELIGEKIDQVVVGRPVHFREEEDKDKAAQDRLEQALKLAGFREIRFEFEPVAAAKQYIASQGLKSKIVFVFDFGGGTLDTAIVDAEKEKVLAEDGIYIGGDLLNADILENKLFSYFGSDSVWGDAQIAVPIHIFEGLKSWYSIPNLNNPETLELLERIKYRNNQANKIDKLKYLITANLGFDLYEAIEKAKKQLSTSDESIIRFKNGPIEIEEKITRIEFEQIIAKRVEEIKEVVLKTLAKANLKGDEIDVVVRTGGSSLIPIFEKMLIEIFGKEKITQFETFTSISAGLALEKN